MKRDKVLTRAIIISVAVHLVAIGLIGRSSNTRLNASIMSPVPQRLMNVVLVKDPLGDPPKPKPVVVPPPKPDMPAPKQGLFANIASRVFGPPPSRSTPTRVANNAGGALNTGTSDRNGDIAMRSGNTSVGTVPGSGNGRGNGSGNGSGVNHTDPPAPAPVRPVYVQPTPPPPPVPPPPAPKRIGRKICEASGMLAGQYCKNPREASFTEGDEPRHNCNRCKAPEPVHVNKIADRANPSLTHDVSPRADSIDEGLSLRTEIDYYVDTDGSVSGVRVSRSSGNRDWDRAVTSAASQWRYSPAVQDGTPRRVKVTRSVGCKT